MCGICGVFHHGSSVAEVDEPLLVRMRDTMVHRGPDGHGLWVAGDRRSGLGHRRLAIVELGESGAQPMANEDGTCWISYNGEIYNHAALRAVLSRQGHRFRTDHADTEAILHAYEEWGPACVEQFEGMFAFAIVDQTRGRLFLARDRLGVKPLYLAFRPGLVLFASEIKALLRHPAVTPAVSSAALYHYLSFLTTPAPYTLFEGILKLPAGTTLLVDRHGRIEARRYWDALPPGGRYHRELDGLSESAQEDFCVQGIRARLDRAVEKRMMADVPFGVLLSGGIDSSLAVSLMSRHLSEPVRTFTVGYKDHTYANEVDQARLVARHFGTEHHEILIDESDALAFLPDLIHHQDEPLADWVCIPVHYVSRLAREHSTIVVQVGEGSDELFCGYDHYLRYIQLARLARPFARLPSVLRRSLAAAAGAAADLSGLGSFYADAADRAARGRELFWGGAVAFWERDKHRLLAPDRFRDGAGALPDALAAFAPLADGGPDSFGVVAPHLREIDRAFPGADVFTRMTYLECKLRLPELLLMRVDKMTMATSVEARVPFLDHALVEFTMGIPLSIKVKHGVPKYLLKKAAAGLVPDPVIARRKMGFGAPMAEWLRGDLGRVVRDTVMQGRLRREGYFDEAAIGRLFAAHQAGRDRSLAIWTIYNLAAWFDHWIAGDA